MLDICDMQNLKWLNVRQLIMFDTAVLVYQSRNEQVKSVQSALSDLKAFHYLTAS